MSEQDRTNINSPEDAASAVKVRRPKRVAGATYAIEDTIFTEERKKFGRTRLRKDHGAEINLTPKEKYDFIRACYAFAVITGRVDVLQGQLDKLEETIRKFTDANPGLAGAEFDRLDESVTDVAEVQINKPDVKLIREATGSAFPQLGTEQVNASFIIPEETQKTGDKITAEGIAHMFELAVVFAGADRETVVSNLDISRTMKVTDREAIFEAVNKGTVPEEALHLKRGKNVKVSPLHPRRVSKNTSK